MRNKIIPYLVILLLILVAFGFRDYVAFSDAASTWINPDFKFRDVLYSWNSLRNTGFYASNNSTNIFLYGYYALISLISNNPEHIQKLTWISVFFLSGSILFSKMRKIINNDMLTVTAVIFAFFNPVSIYYFWQIQHWTYYLAIPYILGILEYIEYIKDLRISHLIRISLIWFLFGFCFVQPAYFASFPLIIFPIFIYALMVSSDKRKIICDSLKFTVIFISVNFVYIYPLMRGSNEMLSTQINNYSSGTYIPILEYLKNMNFFYSFINTSYGSDNFFLNNQFFNIGWTLTIAALLYFGFVIPKKDKSHRNTAIITILSIVFIGFVFLNKGLSPPFSGFSEFIYNHKLMYIFRAYKEKFAIGYSTLISLLFMYALASTSRKLRIFLIGVSVISYVIFVSDLWLPEDRTQSGSLAYLDRIKMFAQPGSRLLNLPLTNYSFFYSENPKYIGDNPMRNYFRKDTVFSTFNEKNDTYKIKRGLDEGNLNESFFETYLKTYNIEYILVNRSSYVLQDELPHAFNPQILDNFRYLTPILNDRKFLLYRYPDYLPRITARNISFKKINPTLYRISVRNLRNSDTLAFLETYHPGWNLSITRFNDGFACDPVYKDYENSVTECRQELKYISAGDIFTTGTGRIFDSTHRTIYGYANAWTIDNDTVIRNFSPEYFRLNPDGSVDINLNLYFQPQNNYYLGITISLMALLIIPGIAILRKLSHEKQK